MMIGSAIGEIVKYVTKNPEEHHNNEWRKGEEQLRNVHVVRLF